MSGIDEEVRTVAEALCDCARSRGRHSVYCPAWTALRNLKRALEGHRARMMGWPEPEPEPEPEPGRVTVDSYWLDALVRCYQPEAENYWRAQLGLAPRPEATASVEGVVRPPEYIADTYTDPPPIDATTATVRQRQKHTLRLLADAERALYRVRMEGTFMGYGLTDTVAQALGTLRAARTPDTVAGVGLHPAGDSDWADDGPPPPGPGETAVECCASGRCEVCRPDLYRGGQ